MRESERQKRPVIHPLTRIDLPVPNRSVLENGAHFTLMENTVQEDVFRLDILLQGGQWRQTMPLQSSFTNRMLGEGTKSMTSAEIGEKLDQYGAWVDYGTGVSTNVIYLFSLNKYASETLQVLESLIKEPVFPSSEFNVMVENARQRYWVNSKKVDSQARIAFSQMVLGNLHPLAKYANLEDYDRISILSLQDFYTRYYHSANSSVYLSGNPDSKVRQLVLRSFGEKKWGADSTIVPLAPVTPVSVLEKRKFIECPTSQQSAVQMGCLTIRQNHSDYTALSVAVTALGGYFGSRLMSNIREEKGYTYGIGAGLAPNPFETVFMIVSQCDARYVEPLIQEVYSEINRLRNEAIPVEELEMVKSYMFGELIRRYEGLSLAEAFSYAEVFGFPDTYLQQRVDEIKAVTQEDILRVAQLYLCPDRMKEVIVGKKL